MSHPQPAPEPVLQLAPVTSVMTAGLPSADLRLVAGLEAEGVHTRTADDAAHALDLVAAAAPDVVVMGESLQADLPSLLFEIRQLAPSSWILFLLSQPSLRRSAYLVSLGMDDVLAPPHSAEGVLHRVALGRLLAERGSDPAANGVGGQRLWVDRFSRTVRARGASIGLTLREFELLERLCAADGRVVSRDTLLTDIWGHSQDSEAVLDATVHRLRRKLELDPTAPRLLVTVRGVGYRIEAATVVIQED